MKGKERQFERAMKDGFAFKILLPLPDLNLGMLGPREHNVGKNDHPLLLLSFQRTGGSSWKPPICLPIPLKIRV